LSTRRWEIRGLPPVTICTGRTIAAFHAIAVAIAIAVIVGTVVAVLAKNNQAKNQTKD
jgi:hypothetical protein